MSLGVILGWVFVVAFVAWFVCWAWYQAGLSAGRKLEAAWWRNFHDTDLAAERRRNHEHMVAERRMYERRLLDIAAVATRPDVRVHIPEFPKGE